MQDLKTLFDFVLSLFQMEFTIYGYTLSFWTIIIWSIIGGFVLWLIVKLFTFGGGD